MSNPTAPDPDDLLPPLNLQPNPAQGANAVPDPNAIQAMPARPADSYVPSEEFKEFRQAYISFIQKDSSLGHVSRNKAYYEVLQAKMEEMNLAFGKKSNNSQAKAELELAQTIFEAATFERQTNTIGQEGFDSEQKAKIQMDLSKNAVATEKKLNALLEKSLFKYCSDSTFSNFASDTVNHVREATDNIKKSSEQATKTFESEKSSVIKVVKDHAWEDFSKQFSQTDGGAMLSAVSTATKVAGKGIGLSAKALSKILHKTGNHEMADVVENLGKGSEEVIKVTAKGVEVAGDIANILASHPDYTIKNMPETMVKFFNKVVDKLEKYLENSGKIKDYEMLKKAVDMAKTCSGFVQEHSNNSNQPFGNFGHGLSNALQQQQPAVSVGGR